MEYPHPTGIILFLYNTVIKKFLVCINPHEYTIKEYDSVDKIPEKYLNSRKYRISNNKYVMKIDYKKKKIDLIKTSFQSFDFKDIYEKNKDIDEVILNCLYRKFKERTGHAFSDIKFDHLDTLDSKDIGNRRIYLVQTSNEYIFPYTRGLRWMDKTDLEVACKNNFVNVNWTVSKVLELLDF
jgi:hypothetical protein